MPENDQENSPPKATKMAGKTTRTKPRKQRLLTLAQLDARTLAYQELQRSISAITSDLGGQEGLSEVERLQVQNLALSAIILRDIQTKWLKGEDIHLGDLIAMENSFNRTAASLGTARRPKDVVT
jgi:hypothetical protein